MNVLMSNRFVEYTVKYGKNYNTLDEFTFRLEQFSRNLQTIADLQRKLSTSTVSVNEFSDWTEDEYL